MFSRTIKVGIFTLRDLNRPGGTAIRVSGITKFLREYACDPVLFSGYSVPAELKGKVHPVMVNVRKVNFSASLVYCSYPQYFFFLERFLEKSGPEELWRADIDLLHCHKNTSATIAMGIRRKINVPMLFDVHGIISLQREDMSVSLLNKGLYPMLIRAERNFYKFFDGVSVASERLKEFVTKRFEIPEDRVYVIPDGVDIDLFKPEQRLKERNKVTKKGELSGKTVILFAGSFKIEGGVQDLAEGFRNLSCRHSDVILILIGDGNLMPYIKSFKRTHGLKNMLLKGIVSREEFRKYQNIADIVVSPERSYPYKCMDPSIKLFECLASGKATVATKLLSVCDIVQNGKHAILVNPGNPQSLVKGIERLLIDQSLREKIGKNGRELVLREYTYKKAAEKAFEAYKDLINKYQKD